MPRNTWLAALALSLPITNAAHAQIVHAKAADTIGCLSGEMLLTVKQQVAGTTPAPGWQDRIASLNCYPVAADLNWRVGAQEGGIVHAQLDMPGAPMPALWFSADDMAPGPGPSGHAP